MTLGDLKTQFKGILNNGVVNNNTALVGTFINQSIQRIQRELRVPFMEKQILVTIPTTYTALAIPSDLLELISLMVDTDNDGIMDYALQRVDLDRVALASERADTPVIYSRQGGAWIVGPKPTAGSKVLITYYAEFTPLVADTDTNTLSSIAWDAVVYGALSFACDFLVDDRAKQFDTRYTQIVASIQEQADADELTADAAVRPALYYDNDGDCW